MSNAGTGVPNSTDSGSKRMKEKDWFIVWFSLFVLWHINLLWII